jgi:DNA-binding NarL/FixJ family response regulator
MHDHPHLRPLVQRSGAKGIVPKSRATDELTPALQAILAGQTYYH